MPDCKPTFSWHLSTAFLGFGGLLVGSFVTFSGNFFAGLLVTIGGGALMAMWGAQIESNWSASPPTEGT